MTTIYHNFHFGTLHLASDGGSVLICGQHVTAMIPLVSGGTRVFVAGCSDHSYFEVREDFQQVLAALNGTCRA